MRTPSLKPVVFLLLLAAHGLLIWHAVYGKRSFTYQQQVRQQLAQVRATHEDARLQREQLQRTVARLRRATLDLDVLDEEARRQLGFIAPGELLLLPDNGG